MSMVVILDAAAQTARLLPSAVAEKIGGAVTKIAVPDDFSWVGKKVDWATKTIVDDLASLEAALLTQVKDEGESRKMTLLSVGGAKKMIYAKQQAEVDYYYSLGGTATAILAAIALLPADIRKRRFRYASLSAARRGEATITAAITRFAAGIEATDSEVARIEAIEQAGCIAIRAAGTLAAKRAALDAIDWNWVRPT